MKNITIGYLNLLNKTFLSSIVINENFLNLLSRYAGVKIIPVPRRKDLKNYFEKIETYELDYLYVDSFETLLPPFLLREKLGLDIPFIVTLHTIFPWALDYYARMIPLIRNDDLILTPSHYAKKCFWRISKEIKIHVIANCLDIQHIQKNLPRNTRSGTKKNIAFMGRLTEKKGIGTLIRCMPEIIKRAGNVHLNIIGPLSGSKMTDSPKDKYVKKLEAEIKRLGLTDKVNFMGARFGLEKYRLLSRSDIFINPTLAREENFPIVNIEALACGIPVIATDWAANKEIIINGKNGYLVNVHNNKNGRRAVNSDALASVIAKVLTDPAVNLKLKEGAAKTAKQYDYRKVLPGLINLLEKRKIKGQTKALSGRRPGAATRGLPKARTYPSSFGNRWNMIRNKTVTHFSYLFNRDFLFFICGISNQSRIETYGDLYNRAVEPKNFKSKKLPVARKIVYEDNIRYKKIMDNLFRDYKNFLCLRGKVV